MTAYKGINRKIKDALITILTAIKYDGGGGEESAFVQVLDNTAGEFEGYPSIRLLPNNIKSVTSDNRSKDRTVAFAAIMHFELQDAGSIETGLYNQMLDLTDLIIDTLEHGDYIDQLSTIDPSIPDWWMNVTDARWYVASGKAGALLLCNVNIEITYSKSVY